MFFFLFYKFLFFISDFLKIQRKSFRTFLDHQLGSEFAAINPIIHSRKLTLNFIYENYKFVKPTLSIEESILLSKTYCCHFYLPVLFEPLIDDLGKCTDFQEIQWFFLGTLPLLTRRGHFIINGTPRIVLNQIVRSPGVYFGCLENSPNLSSQHFYAEIISKRGPWIRLQMDQKKKVWVSIQQNKKNKISLISFLKNLYDRSLDHHFFLREKKKKLNFQTGLANGFFSPSHQNLSILKEENRSTLEIMKNRISKSSTFFKANEDQQKFDRSCHSRLFSQVLKIFRLFLKDVSINSTLKTFKDQRQLIKLTPTLCIYETHLSSSTYLKVAAYSGILQIRRRLDFIENLKIHNLLLKNFFFERSSSGFFEEQTQKHVSIYSKFYFDLGQLGRRRLNQRCGLLLQTSKLTPIDFLAISDLLYKLTQNFRFTFDDRDDLRNRRLKTIGELLQNQCTRGLLRLQKSLMKTLKKTGWTEGGGDDAQQTYESQKYLYNGFAIQRKENEKTFLQNHLHYSSLNCQALNSTFKEFFHSHQLSQFLDQSNPLAEITHKRRLSCMGTGGVNRETAGMDIRGIHRTHYGRICPIETPEGQNAGLVNSLTTIVHLQKDGFLETPFIEIYKQHFQNQRKIAFLSAEHQELQNIFLSSTVQKSRKNLSVTILKSQSFQKCSVHSVDFVAWTPQQFLSIATTCIPFVEHNDANRALMGSNMQRQALPLMHLEQPIVNTFNAFRVLSDLKDIPTSTQSGLVVYVSQQKTSFYHFQAFSECATRAYFLRRVLENRKQLNFTINQNLYSCQLNLFLKLRKKKFLLQTLSFID